MPIMFTEAELQPAANENLLDHSSGKLPVRQLPGTTNLGQPVVPAEKQPIRISEGDLSLGLAPLSNSSCLSFISASIDFPLSYRLLFAFSFHGSDSGGGQSTDCHLKAGCLVTWGLQYVLTFHSNWPTIFSTGLPLD